ncbi:MULTISPECIES: flagellar basal body-associated FliL family protein [unclassified Roseovarius]|uniref:flagellar basal body-associated FliL family protein n=1 Tax=unclassified Roseovarius TaxID=2614913 RepID=UPI00273E13C0|nr:MULTISPECIES: flagellar basal body-associated FliL family protein [unclassified Roseovarius]
MIGKLLPVILAVVGVGGGIGAGLALKPEPAEMAAENPCGDVHHEVAAKEPEHAEDDAHGAEETVEYIKLNNQFLVPVVADERIKSLVVMTLSVEIQAGQGEVIYSREPKLRDAFLQVLFDHANIGGFRGEFTNARNLDVLRNALLEVAQTIAGDSVNGVLITDIARQDV